MSQHHRHDLFEAFAASIASAAGCPSHAYLLDELTAAIGRREGMFPERCTHSDIPRAARLLTRGLVAARIWLAGKIGGDRADGITRQPKPELSLW